MAQTEYRPEQFRVRDILAQWFFSLSGNLSFPNYCLMLEYEVRDWMKFGNVGGVELRGMPTLDLAIIFPGRKERIGIQLDGEIHRGLKKRLDENQVIVLEKRWGKTIRFVKEEDDRIWNGNHNEAFSQIKESIEPILKEFHFL